MEGERTLYSFTFADIFAGIGGMRMPFDELGGRCVFSCEWDDHARRTYVKNFQDLPHGDIHDVPYELIPTHEILLAGFPCQPFSLAGVSKKNALKRAHGFKDETQGTLFFELQRIIERKQPAAFLLENVKNLQHHDHGKTYEIIMRTLKKRLKYHVFDKMIDAKFAVPQHRERIFIVGFREDIKVPFEFPTLPSTSPRLGSILEEEVDKKYTLTNHLWDYLQKYAKKHREKGNGFGYSLFGPEDVTRTLSARYHKDGSEILIHQAGSKNPRRLTPRECARLMGFPEDFTIAVSDTQAYRQFGNAVVVPVVRLIAEPLLKCLIKAKIIKSRRVRAVRSRSASQAGAEEILLPFPGETQETVSMH